MTSGLLDGLEVIVVTGAQAVGKTTLAREVARRTGAAVISRDPLMGNLSALGYPADGHAGLGLPDLAVTGFYLQGTFLAMQLAVGLSCVVEAVCVPEMLEQWQDIASGAGAGFTVVECVCSDVELQHRRFDARAAAATSWRPLAWSEVEETLRDLEPWPNDKLVLDSVLPVADLADAVVRHVTGRR